MCGFWMFPLLDHSGFKNRMTFLFSVWVRARLAFLGDAEKMHLSHSWNMLLLPPTATGGILFLMWCTRKLNFVAQFLVLLAMGVTLSFLLLMIVQLPEYRSWLATLLVLMVFIASPIAVRIFLRSLKKEENEKAEELHSNES
jgi:hypothetical protein